MIWDNQESACMNLICFQAVPSLDFSHILLNAVIVVCHVFCRNTPIMIVFSKILDYNSEGTNILDGHAARQTAG